MSLREVKLRPAKTKQSKQLRETCARCNLAVNASQRGSLTGWIFQESICKCDRSRAQQSDVSTGSQPATSRELKPTEIDVQNLLGSRYEILDGLGQGGMGTVYKVKDLSLNKVFAIKLLRPELMLDAQIPRRFEKEVEIASKLEHANLVHVYGHGAAADGRPYVVMDYVDGESLEQIIKRDGPLEMSRLLNICVQICEAVESAHAMNVIHRDLKPSNIIITTTDGGAEAVKVVDFGIAKVLPTAGRETSTLTKTGEVFGSPLYMSPEQCQGNRLDKRSDIYSMGCVMFEAVTGQTPFSDSNPMKIILKHLYDKPPEMRLMVPDRKVPDEIQMIVTKCLEKTPNNRYVSVAQLSKQLRLAEEGKLLSEQRRASLRATRLKYVYWALPILLLFIVAATVLKGPVVWHNFRPGTPWSTLDEAVNSVDATEPTVDQQMLESELDRLDSYNLPFGHLFAATVYDKLPEPEQARRHLILAKDLLERRGQQDGNLVYTYKQLVLVDLARLDYQSANHWFSRLCTLMADPHLSVFAGKGAATGPFWTGRSLQGDRLNKAEILNEIVDAMPDHKQIHPLPGRTNGFETSIYAFLAGPPFRNFTSMYSFLNAPASNVTNHVTPLLSEAALAERISTQSNNHKDDSDDAFTMAQYAVDLEDAGKFAQSAELFKRAAVSAQGQAAIPDDPAFLEKYRQGTVACNQHKLALAERCLQNALSQARLRKDNSEELLLALNKLGDVLFQEQKYDRANAAQEEFLSLARKLTKSTTLKESFLERAQWTWLKLAEADLMAGNPDNAKTVYEMILHKYILTLDPSYCMDRIGCCLELSGKNSEAAKMYAQASQSATNETSLAYSAWAQANFQLRQANYVAADKLYHTALSYFAKYKNSNCCTWQVAQVKQKLALCYLKQGNSHDAVPLFKESLDYFDAHPGNWHHIGWLKNYAMALSPSEPEYKQVVAKVENLKTEARAATAVWREPYDWSIIVADLDGLKDFQRSQNGNQ